MSQAYQTFQQVLGRAVDLHSHANQPTPGISQPVIDDILRSSLVLGIAAMDGYFTDRFVESFTGYVKAQKKTPALLEMLNKAGLNASVAVDLLMMERPFRRLRTLITDYLEDYTTQKTNVIDGLFLAYGIKDLTRHACARAKRLMLPGRISAAAARRNSIVHDGDLNSHDRQRAVDGRLFKRHLNDITLYVQHCETHINGIVPV